VARIFGDIEDVWAALFKAMGNPPYPMPTVVLFSFGTSSACGLVRAEVGRSTVLPIARFTWIRISWASYPGVLRSRRLRASEFTRP